MKIAFITRSTLNKVPGGDTEQVLQTMRFLQHMGVGVDLYLTTEKIDYNQYDLIHAFNITRPADILYHINKSPVPVVVSTILVDYNEFDTHHRNGLPGLVLRLFPAGTNEYIKTVARWVLQKDSLRSKSFLWKGQDKSIREIIHKAGWLLPNSNAEYKELELRYGIRKAYSIIPNGVDDDLYTMSEKFEKNKKLVLSAARIEGRKNQLNLIRAMNNTEYTLLLTGLPAPNQRKYYEACKKEAARNIIFCGRVPINTLISYYGRAGVHALPSWHETCGLSSLEAAAMGCNVVITDKGFTREYFGDEAFYCDPGNPASIYHAVVQAAGSAPPRKLQEKVLQHYTWQQAATTTLQAYKNILGACKN